MPTSRDYDELRNMNLVQKKVKQNQQDAYEMRVLSAKKYAAIEEAVQKQSITHALQAQLDANQKAHSDWLAAEQLRINTHLANMKNSNASAKAIAAEKRRLDAQLAADRALREQDLATKQQALNAEIAKSKEEDAKRVANIASRLADAEYKKATIYQRRQIQEELTSKAHAHAVEIENQRTANAEALQLLRNKKRYVVKGSEEEKAYQAQITALVEKQNDLKLQQQAAEQAEQVAYTEKLRLQEDILKAQREYVLTQTNHNGAAQLLQNIESATEEAKAKLEQLDIEIAVNQKLGVDTTELEHEKEQISKSVEQYEQIFQQSAQDLFEAAAADAAQKKHDEAEIQLKKAKAVNSTDMAREKKDQRELEKVENTKEAQANWQNFLDPTQIGDKLGKAAANAIENVAAQISAALNQIDENIDAFYQYQSSVEARLQGSQESFQSSLKAVSKNVGISGLVRQKDVIENIKKLAEAGVAYNLDLRAFLATISDDIAQTFDVFDSNLMRLIRLQQSDTTVARLGMEASLNKLFNQYFSDTSYLTDAADSVSQAIIDANSQLTKDMSIEFEYMIQKWLGALYSVGMDQGTISTIAQGLNYLGTGNVEALNGNDSLQSLLAMSASRAGISYADILTGGLDAETTNNLMKSMIEYLQSIAENTDNNQVTKSAYSNVFGFSISDLTAVSSLSKQDISSLHKQAIDYQGAMNEYAYQANQIFNRTHFSQMLDTVFENAMMSASTAIGNNSGVYATWKVLNVIEDLTGGIAIPAISVMGNMVDLHTTVTGLAKTGIAGLSLMSSLLSSMFSGSLFGTMDHNSWGYDEFTSRGSATKGISKGTASGTSQSTSMSMVGSSSASDIKSTSLSDATDEASDDSSVTNKDVEGNADIYEDIYNAIASDGTTVLDELINLSSSVSDYWSITNELLREDRIFKSELNGMDSVLSLLDTKRVFLSSLVSVLPFTNGDFTISGDSEVLSVTASAITKATTAVSYPLVHQIASSMDTLSNALTSYFYGGGAGVSTTSVEGGTSNVSNIQSTASQADVNAISTLSAQTSVQAISNNDSTASTLVTEEGLKVSVNQLSPEVNDLIKETIKTMITAIIVGDGSSSGGENSSALIEQLKALLSSQELNVNVVNDHFDTALQKSAFSY